jgi:GR25 family glycosyltransferase involved in LPS biosynthesis
MMLYLGRALLFFFSLSLQADLFDHLKKIDTKELSHSFESINFVYMINLDERPEKFWQASQELARYGILPYRFSAINGWKLPLEILNEVGLVYKEGMTPLFSTSFPIEGNKVPNHGFMTEIGKTYFNYGVLPGTIGITLSHLSILQNAYDAGYETIWVLEDDVVAIQDPRKIPDLIQELDLVVGKEGWDILFTDIAPKADNGIPVLSSGRAKRPDMDCSKEELFSERYTKTEIVSKDFQKISSRFGAYSMIIRRSGIEKLLLFFKEHKIYLPYDLEYYLPKDIRLYSLRYDLVTNLVGALTDNREPGYMENK